MSSSNLQESEERVLFVSSTLRVGSCFQLSLSESPQHSVLSPSFNICLIIHYVMFSVETMTLFPVFCPDSVTGGEGYIFPGGREVSV